ncbi:MAG: hypothetical protein HY275_16395 [Gemmatimonadetes bacterium]|nr:hypothetical protein [Gemmatimonadota bacterium]
MLRSRMSRSCCLAALLACAPCALSAQASADSADALSDNTWHPSARIGSLAVGVPQQLSGSLLFGFERYWGAGTRRFTQMWYLRVEPGLAASKAAVGVGAWQFADQGGGGTLQAAVLRTYGSPWSANTNQTYWGVEARAFVWLVGPYVGYYQPVDANSTKNAFVSVGIAVGF